MLEAEPSSSFSLSDPDPSSEDLSSDSDGGSDSADDPRDRLSCRRPFPVNTGGISSGEDEKTAGRHLRHPVTVKNPHGADAMIAGPNLHLALAGTTIEAVTGVVVATHHPPPPGGIVGAQRLILEDATSSAFAFFATPGERTGPGAFP